MARTFGARSIEIEPILRLPAQEAVAATRPMTWLRMRDMGGGCQPSARDYRLAAG
jgi:hypothetical protein